jgi:hypothetical protein
MARISVYLLLVGLLADGTSRVASAQCSGGGQSGTGAAAAARTGGGVTLAGTSSAVSPAALAYQSMLAQVRQQVLMQQLVAKQQLLAQQQYQLAQQEQAERQEKLAARRARAEQTRAQIAAKRQADKELRLAANPTALLSRSSRPIGPPCGKSDTDFGIRLTLSRRRRRSIETLSSRGQGQTRFVSALFFSEQNPSEGTYEKALVTNV